MWADTASRSAFSLAAAPGRSLEWPSVYATRLLLSLLILAVACSPAVAGQNGHQPPNLSAEAYLLLDPEGRTLHAKNAGLDRAPASLVKLMTLYLACEAMDAGRITPDEMVTVSRHAATTPRYRMGLRTGDR